MENVLNIPEITNNTIQYFVDGEFVENVTVDQVNKIRENVINYIIITLLRIKINQFLISFIS